MATVNGTEYDHIDIKQGSTTTKHMLKDATARGDIENLKSAFSDTAVKLTDNLIDPNNAELGIINESTGGITSSSSWYHSDYIPVRPGETYKWIGISNSHFAFYDIGKKYVDVRYDPDVCTSNNLKSVIKIPSNIYYARITVNSSYLDTAIFSAVELQTGNKTINQKFVDLDKKSFDGLNAKCAMLYASGETSLNPEMYIRGSFSNTNLEYSLYYATQRAVSKYPQCYPYDISFSADANTTMLAYLIANDGTVTTSGVTYSRSNIRIPKNTKFYLCIEKNSPDTIKNICDGVTVNIPQDEVNGLPAYYFADGYIGNKIDTIIDKSPLDGLQFAFLTDVHVRQNAGNSPALIEYIRGNTNAVPFVAFGGDVNVSTVDEGVDVLEDARIWQSWMNKMGKVHVYQAQGNHDYLGFHYVESERVAFYESLGVCRQLVIGNLEDAHIVGVPGKLWYYVEIPTAKTRIIFLNDYDTTRNDGVFYGYNGMSVDQIQWVIDKALDTDGIRVIFVSHQTYDEEMEGENQQVFVGMQRLFTAIANKTAYSYGAIQKDFTNSTIEFVAHICGHMHADASNVNDGVLTIQTTCDGIMNNNEGRTAGTITEQAFDIVTIDYTNGKLYMTRIGYGSDREFDLT